MSEASIPSQLAIFFNCAQVGEIVKGNSFPVPEDAIPQMVVLVDPATNTPIPVDSFAERGTLKAQAWGGGETIHGELREISADHVSIARDRNTVTTIVDYDRVFVERERPRLVLRGAPRTALLTYVTGKLSWNPRYQMFLHSSGSGPALLLASSIVANRGDKDIDVSRVQVELVPQNLSIPFVPSQSSTQEIARPRMAMAQSRSVTSAAPSTMSFDSSDESHFDLREDGNGWSGEILTSGPLDPSGTFETIPRGVTELPGEWFNGAVKVHERFFLELGNSEPFWGFAFEAPTYLPAGRVNLFNPEMLPIGSSKIRESQSGETVSVKVPTNGRLLQVETTVSQKEDPRDEDQLGREGRIATVRTIRYVVKIRNRQDKPYVIVFSMPLDEQESSYLVVRPGWEKPRPMKIRRGKAEWMSEIAPESMDPPEQVWEFTKVTERLS